MKTSRTNARNGGPEQDRQLKEAIEIFTRSSALLIQVMARRICSEPTEVLSDETVEQGVLTTLKQMMELVKTHESNRTKPN